MLLLLALFVTGTVSENTSIQWQQAPEADRDDGVLKQVHILFRHGHRVPMTRFPTDPNANASLWDDGRGQLTNLGRKQAFQLGVDIRSRYGFLLPKERAWQKVETTSSDVKRTLMTAATVLAGLLPPRGADRWSDMDWQPAPVHTQSMATDNILISSLNCPKYKALIHGSVDTVTEETQKIYDYITANSGMFIKSSKTISRIYSCLEIERDAGLELSNWTRRVFPDFMKNETSRHFSSLTRSTEMKRLRAGPLLKQLLKFDPKTPLKLYSTHDIVLSGLAGALGLDLHTPGFMSVFAIEYRAKSEDEIYAQLWWREGPNDNLTRLEWANCGMRCSLRKLTKILEPLIPQDWYEECSSDKPTYSAIVDKKDYTGPTTFIALLTLLVLVTIVLYRRKHTYELIS